MIPKKLKIKSVNGIPNTPWAFFFYVIKPHRKLLFLATTFIVVASTISSMSNYLYKLIVDAVEVSDFEKALFFGILFPVIIFLIQLFYRFAGLVTAYLTTRATKTAVDEAHKYIMDHSHGYFINRFAGSLTNKIKNINNSIDNILPDILFGHLNIFVSFFVSFILILTVDVISGWLFLILLLVLIVTNRYLAPEKARLSKINAEAGTKLQGYVVDVLGNVSLVRQFVKKEKELESLEGLTEKRAITHLKNWLYTEKLLLTNVFIIFIFTIGMTWSLVNKWQLNLISAGDFVLVLSLVYSISGYLLFVGRAFNAMAKTLGELREGLSEILIPHEITDMADAKPLQIEKGLISWKNVDFKFGSEYVFKNFNLEILAGQRVGLVGSSGAGKSTFVSLLLRQHDINGGEILIDSQNISLVTQDSLREAISVVPQEPTLFHRTIRENITYGNSEADLSEVIRVAKQAYAHEFIEKLPLGYDTMVGERGVKLSGGQKQRIAIARAMLKNAPILILDEATSALDSESEIYIQKALHNLMEGKTVIAIAHRLSTLREMDRIIVLQKGKIVEDGNHKNLKDSGGIYSKLWSHQSGGFVVED